MSKAMVLKAEERRDAHTREADSMRRLGVHSKAAHHERCAARWQEEVEYWRGKGGSETEKGRAL